MNTYEVIPQFSKMLVNLDKWIEKATIHAKTKGFEVDTVAQARLAPDQYCFVQQVQSACDSAKVCAAYLSGKEAPKHPDTEKTMADCRTRIKACLSWLETVSEKDVVNADDKKVAPPWLQGKWLKGSEYVLQAAQPNFYFHIVCAYEILRHNGVDLGKMEFIGHVPVKD